MEKARIEAELHGELVHWYKVFGQFVGLNFILFKELAKDLIPMNQFTM
jgi:hypothetical protein